MTLLHLLRAAALTMVVVAIVDPSVSRTRLGATAVAIQVGADEGATDAWRASAVEVRQRLQDRLGDAVSFTTDASPAARVVVGGKVSASHDDLEVPTSIVTFPQSARGARIVDVDVPAAALVGWSVDLKATVEARGLAGQSSWIVLEQEGTEIAAVERKWTSDREHVEIALPYTPAIEGVSRLTVRARPASKAGEGAGVDVGIAGTTRPLRILVHEPRPSWGATFVRRILEANPAFEVSAVVRPSRRIAVRAGSPPAMLALGSFDTYDVVLVGAPEELAATEVAALDAFARVRGGTVVFLPDRRPSGRYLDLVGTADFDEVLVQTPVDLRAASGGALRAGELAIARHAMVGADVHASADVERSERPVIFSRPVGAGTALFSGALDAWRYRDRSDRGFARFWQARIADAALRAPARIEAEIRPAIALPGSNVAIRARVRATELQELGSRTMIPAVQARVIGERGFDRLIRLWPSPQPGVFEGTLRAPDAGRYDVRMAIGNVTADAVLVTAPDARPAFSLVNGAQQASRLLADATGGVAVTMDDLGPLERHLMSLPRSATSVVIHPARSVWFVIALSVVLCTEWILRRMRGLA